MKINRATLERIINEELMLYLEKRLFEAPSIGSPLDDELPPAPPPDDGMDGIPLPAEADGEVPDPEMGDPSDDELDAELAGEEPDGEPGSVAQEMRGKTISKIEHEDESESIPGAQEVVISFEDEEDKLRLIIHGDVKYFWKGLHQEIGSAEDVPPEDIEPEEDMGDDSEALDDEMESLPLPTDAGQEDPENPEV